MSLPTGGLKVAIVDQDTGKISPDLVPVEELAPLVANAIIELGGDFGGSGYDGGIVT